MYFTDDAGTLDTRQEHTIVGSKRPPGPRPDASIAQLLDILDRMRVSLDPIGLHPLRLREPATKITSARAHWVGNQAIDGSSLNETYREFGFDLIPPSSLVSVCPIDGATPGTAEKIRHRLLAAAERRSAKIAFQVVDRSAILARLDEAGSNADVRPHSVLLFVLPRRAERLSPDSATLLRRLDAQVVRYRRCYGDDPLDFSIPDQLQSLVQGVGGRPHRVNLRHGGRPLWSVGIDLSHDRRLRRSQVAVALVDPGGALDNCWLSAHPYDEALQPDILGRLLEAAGRRIEVADSVNAPIIVLRDGRLFERETGWTYRQLGDSVTLIEFRKDGNPPMVRGRAPVDGPAAGTVPDVHTMFISTTPARTGQLATVGKVTWRPNWNELELSPDQITELLVALARAPGLGLHDRFLPAPLYWADGIAGASDRDLRFRGQAHIEL